MAYYDDVPLDFDTREQQLLQQQAQIAALRKIGALPIADPGEAGGFTSAVTGTRVGGKVLKTPTAALLNPLIATGGAAVAEGGLNRARAQLNADQQGDAQRLIEGLGESPSTADFQGLSRNPLTRAIGQKAVEDRLIAAPVRKDAERVALAKAVRESQEKALDRQSRIDAAKVRAGGSGPRLTMVQNDQGVVTGGYDPKSNRTYPLGQLPNGLGDIDTGSPGFKESEMPSVTGNSGQPVVSQPAPVVQGRKAGEVLKAEGALKSKVEETNDVLDMIKGARNALGNTTYGLGESFKEGITGFMGRPADQKMSNAQKLDMIAGNLAAKYPRGPGSITDKERELFVQYMGAINNRVLDPSVRLDNLEMLETMMRNSAANAQAAQAGGAVKAPGVEVRGTGAPSRISDDAGYDALPPGSRFIAPDGSVRVKPR